MSNPLDKVFPKQTQNDWFSPDGSTYRMLPDAIDQLERGLRNAATEVFKCIMRFLARGELDQRATDAEMAKEAGWSESFLQKGLNALDAQMAAINLPPLIIRKRVAGRREIHAGTGLKGKPNAKATTTGPPPGPPPEDTPDTTTPARSSSSPSNQSDRTDGTDRTDRPDPATASLFDRARQLVDGVSLGAIADAIALFTADSVRRALDWMAKRNAKPGNVRKDWGYVLGILLKKKETGWPEDPPAAKPQATKPKAQTIEETAAEDIREAGLRGRWAALSEGEREEIRAAVRAENPGIGRWAGLIEPLCLAELERRQAAEEPRAP